MQEQTPHAETTFALDRVTFRVPGRTLLHPLSLTFPTGKVTGLIGHNGSGKSTLLKMLGRHQPPSAGEVLLDGQPLESWGSKAFARKVAYLPQQLPPAEGMTVRELVAIGRYPWHGALGRFGAADREKVEEAIALVGLKPLAHRLVDSLSGGERQRAWIAMLVAQDSRCLLLDEPTSALDIAHQVDVLALVHRLSQQRGLTVIAVLHDINMAARYCDYLVALRGGEMIAQGTPAELMRSDTLEQIYGIPMGSCHTPGRCGAGKLCLLMMNPTLITRRRLLIAMALSPLLWQMRGAQAADVDPQRVVALEWLPAELLLALGVTPYGVADIPNYRLWVNEPALPDSVIDVGLRTEPNLELLTQMKPSFIVWSAGYGPSPEKLARIAPGRGFTFSDGKRPLAMAQRSLLEMADLLGKTQQAKRHLAEFDALMESLRPRFAGRGDRPLLMISLLDPRHVLVFGENCLFQEVLDRFGIKNAWHGEAAFWGSVSVGIDRLAAFNEADVICFDHGNERDMAQLLATPLWQAMPFVRAGRFQRVPAVWFYGATLSAMHFARVLADAQGVRHEYASLAVSYYPAGRAAGRRLRAEHRQPQCRLALCAVAAGAVAAGCR